MFLVPTFSAAQTGSTYNWFFQNCRPNPPQAPSNLEGRPTLCQRYGGLPIDITVPAIPTPPNGGSITFASTINWGAVNGVVVGKTIAITNGELILDIPLEFWNCKFNMAGGVVIRTTDNNDFIAGQCAFFCCNNMWKGIEAKGNSIISLWGCELEDARTTLQIDDVVPAVYLVSNIFNRNHRNIVNGSFQPGGDGTINLPYFIDNTFECTSNTVFGNGFNNSGAKWTLYHVQLDHCSASLIGGSIVPNRFYDCNQSDAAIFLEDADLVIRNAEFKRFGTVVASDQYGYAIYTAWGPGYSGSHIVVRNSLFETDGAEGAIFAQRSDLEVTDSKINGSLLLSLFSLQNTASEQIKIINNEFNLKTATYVAGIWAERPIASNGKHLEINGNQINQVDAVDHSISGSDGIYIENNFNIHVADQADILDNTFFFDVPDGNGNASGLVNSAIFVNTPSAFDNTRVNGNMVNTGKVFMSNGILFNDQYGMSGEVSHNTINGNGFVPNPNVIPGFSSDGIYVLNATSGVTVCDNTVDGSLIGIRMEADNGQTNLSSNNFGHHVTGLNILDGFTLNGTPIPGSIGEQSGTGNTWLTAAGSYSDKAGRCQSNPGNSNFIIEQQYVPGTSHFPATNLLSPSIGWFFNQQVPSDWCAPMATPSSPRLSAKDLEVAASTGSFLTLSSISQWESRRLLADKLIRYPSLMSGNATAAGFYNTWQYYSPGRFALVENQIREAYAIESADQNAMNGIEVQRGNIQTQLVALESGLTTPLSPTTNPTLAAAKEALLAQLRPLHVQEVALKALIQQKQVTKLQAALTANDQLPTTIVYETNRRLFNRLSIQLFLNGTLNATETAQLMTLTGSGQIGGGLAVEDAKHLLPKCHPSELRSEFGQSSPYQDKQNLVASESNLLISPNPANDLLTIMLNPMDSGRITLIDIAGKTWIERMKSLGIEQLIIRTEEIPTGIYFLSFRTDEGKSLTQKVIVQH